MIAADLASYNTGDSSFFDTDICSRICKGQAKLRDKAVLFISPDCKYERKRGGVSHCYVRAADSISQVGAFARVANTNLSLSSLFVPHLAFSSSSYRGGHRVGDRSRFRQPVYA